MNKPTPEICRTLNWSSSTEFSLIVKILPFGLIPKLNEKIHALVAVFIKFTDLGRPRTRVKTST
ncbi:hypothetical protein DCO44_06515 [Acinetobacter sp. AM]|nr:hypothetical protein DCO44_06515 [Acinetobacter sp. AM]